KCLQLGRSQNRTESNSGSRPLSIANGVVGVHSPTATNSIATSSVSSMFRGRADENMARRRGQRDGWLHEKNGTWLLTYRVYRWDAEKRKSVPARPTVSIGPAEGPGKLTRKQAERCPR